MEEDKKINKKKIVIIVSIFVLLVVVVGTLIIKEGIGKAEQNNQEQVVEEEVGVEVTGKAVDEKTKGSYKVSNVNMVAKQSQTEIQLTIKNISSKSTKERDVYVKYLNKDKKEIGKTRIHLPKMQEGKEVTISTIIMKDLKDATDYVIEY